MNVIVDTSVWSLSLRKEGYDKHPTVIKLIELIEQNADIYMVGVIFQEILQAFRKENVFNRIVKYLESFPLLNVDRRIYTNAARIHCRCAAEGLSATTIDCLIASATINSDSYLLTADKDFTYMTKVSDLKLL